VLTIPLSAVRLASGFGNGVKHLPTETFVVEFIYSLSGAVNVLLFFFARSDLLHPRNKLGTAPGNAGPGVRTGHERVPAPSGEHGEDPDLARNELGEASGNVGTDVQSEHEPRVTVGGADGTWKPKNNPWPDQLAHDPGVTVAPSSARTDNQPGYEYTSTRPLHQAGNGEILEEARNS
jgi:hypothetical protein